MRLVLLAVQNLSMEDSIGQLIGNSGFFKFLRIHIRIANYEITVRIIINSFG